MTFEFLEHTADTAVRIAAPDGPALLREALRATLAIYLGPEGLETVKGREELPIAIEAEDGETLLVCFLNELVFLFDSRRFLARELRVDELTFEPSARLVGVLLGESMDTARHRLQTEIKAATFHDIEIRATEGGLTVDVVFDL